MDPQLLLRVMLGTVLLPEPEYLNEAELLQHTATRERVATAVRSLERIERQTLDLIFSRTHYFERLTSLKVTQIEALPFKQDATLRRLLRHSFFHLALVMHYGEEQGNKLSTTWLDRRTHDLEHDHISRVPQKELCLRWKLPSWHECLSKNRLIPSNEDEEQKLLHLHSCTYCKRSLATQQWDKLTSLVIIIKEGIAPTYPGTHTLTHC